MVVGGGHQGGGREGWACVFNRDKDRESKDLRSVKVKTGEGFVYLMLNLE